MPKVPEKLPKSVFLLGAWGRFCRTLRGGNGAAAGVFSVQFPSAYRGRLKLLFQTTSIS
ncbi:hypothetical protein NEISICOT_02397 [Neisseria sicca ATCC 29256]|uniref:Uncharacterized protein n=1 Tax=Neisseria sicca ATCC 29256 TaxID=547045 RepID=C6M790_NEISI|nr:hypothetical protein NEISICOT_02397 [Neisseria sicca ATCC 29256]